MSQTDTTVDKPDGLPSAPRPRWSQVFVSLVVIGVSILLVSLAISRITIFWEPLSVVGGSLLLVVASAAGWLQYAGCFRGSATSAKAVGLLHFVPVVVLVVPLAAAFMGLAIGESLFSLDYRIPMFLLVYVLFCGLAGWSSIVRSRALQAWLRETRRLRRPQRRVRWQFSLRELLAMALVVALVAGLTTWMTRGRLPQYGINVAADQTPLTLPAAARDVCYCQGSGGSLACEFTIDEQGFLEWRRLQMVRDGARSGSDSRLTPCTNTIVRYPFLSSRLPGPDRAWISRGYCHELYFEGVSYAYDQDARRAYYWRHRSGS